MNRLKNSDLFQEKCYIDGKWLSAKSKETFEVKNPSTGKVLGRVPKMGAEETLVAIGSATEALPLWSLKTAKERGGILRRFYELILEEIEDLAKIVTLEQGKPFADALAEIKYGASFLEWFAEEAKRTYGDIIPSVSQGQRLLVIKQPIGVVCAITPWNFPHAMITRKCAPALAAGCTIVIKPAEATPFSALALAFLAEKAGIPAGVFNVITGDPACIGQEMTSNPLVRKISFTGSTRVGKILAAQSSSTLKKVSLELGGSAPFIVFEDADIQSSVEGLIASKFRNSGQSCICADRIFVAEAIYEVFAKALLQKVLDLKVGDGFEQGVHIGPLINEMAVDKVEKHIQDAVNKGAVLLCGGNIHSLGGTFFEPTILTEVDSTMLIMREETFGPVIPLIRFKSEKEVIQMANDTRYGLASYFFTQNIDRMWRVSEQLEFGMVGVNSGLLSNEVAPFGGVKESGIGREGSKYGIDEYLEMKYICIKST